MFSCKISCYIKKKFVKDDEYGDFEFLKIY